MPNTQKQKEGSYQIEETNKYGPNERIELQTKELNKMEINNLSDAEFKTLVVRMLQELIGYFSSIIKTQAKMKVTLSEIKKNIQGTNSDRKETGTQINGVDQKEERNTNQKRMKKQEFKKMRGLGTSRTS